MAAPSDVIDWDEAMEQCGDDEEFLRELLGDLRGETDAQLIKIEETIRVSLSVQSSSKSTLGTSGRLSHAVFLPLAESNRQSLS